MVSLEYYQIHGTTKATKTVLVSMLSSDTLIASQNHMRLASDFVPCYTWMKRTWLFCILAESFHRLFPPDLPAGCHSNVHFWLHLCSSHLRKCSLNCDIQYSQLNLRVLLTKLWEYSLRKLFIQLHKILSALASQAFRRKMQIQRVGGFQYVNIHSPSVILQPFEPTCLF